MPISSNLCFRAPMSLSIVLYRSMAIASAGFVHQTLWEINDCQKKYGYQGGHFKSITPRTVLVEYSSPNIAKKFHAGHFRSTIVGQTISNMLGAVGHDVTRVNYLGDWGMQFAVLLLGFESDGNRRLLQESPIKHLLEVYVKANKRLSEDPAMKVEAQELFLKMEQGGDENIANFWKFCRDASVEEYKMLYEKMNVVFDIYESESMYHKKAKEIVARMSQQGCIVKLASGAKGVDIQYASWYRPGLESTPAVMRNNGTSLYLTRDLAAAISRKEKYDFDQMVYITDKAQEDHFTKVFCILELLGYEWAKKPSGSVQHIPFGRVIGMKTRTGEAVFLEDLLKEAYQKMEDERLLHSTRKLDLENEPGVLHTLALSGLICNELKPKLSTDFRFSWTSALQSKGDTGLFLQYTHSRLQSLKRNCGVDLKVNVDCSSLVREQTAMDLVIHLSKLNDVIWQAYLELEPSHLMKYMLKLSHLIAKAHKKLNVKGQKPEIAQPRLLLFNCAQIVLSNCMKVVNIQPLDKM